MERSKVLKTDKVVEQQEEKENFLIHLFFFFHISLLCIFFLRLRIISLSLSFFLCSRVSYLRHFRRSGERGTNEVRGRKAGHWAR